NHDPFVYFDDVTQNNNAQAPRCIQHVRPYAELQTDLINDRVARYNFISPHLCNDMHDACAPLNDPILQGDVWLSTEVPKILASRAYANNGALFILWDEADSGGGPIGMIVLSPCSPSWVSSSSRDVLEAWSGRTPTSPRSSMDFAATKRVPSRSGSPGRHPSSPPRWSESARWLPSGGALPWWMCAGC